MLPQYALLPQLSLYPATTQVMLLHAMAGLKPVTELTRPLDTVTRELFEDAGFSIELCGTARPSASITTTKVRIWDDPKADKILEESGIDADRFLSCDIQNLDYSIRGRLFGFHEEEIEYWSRFSPEERRGLLDVVASYELCDRWMSQLPYTRIDELIRNEMDYLSYNYVITPARYSARMEPLIEERGAAVKMTDHLLYLDQAYSNLATKLEFLLDPRVHADHERLVGSGFATRYEFKRAQQFSATLYEHLPELKTIMRT